MVNSQVLVLNRSFLPVHVTTVRRAFTLLYIGLARAVDEEFKTIVEGTGEPDRTTDRLPVTLRAQTATAPYLDKKEIREAIAGKSRAAAVRAIRDRVESPTPPQITISPGWAPRLPRMAGRITVSFAAAR